MNNQKGFTLIESLFTLFIFLLIASSLPSLLSGVTMMERKLSPSKEYEWNLFSHQFRQEFRGAQSINVSGVSVSFVKNGEEILFEEYGDFLRRRVNRRGHEIVLGPFTEISFSHRQGGVEIIAEFDSRLSMTGRFFTFESAAGQQ